MTISGVAITSLMVSQLIMLLSFIRMMDVVKNLRNKIIDLNLEKSNLLSQNILLELQVSDLNMRLRRAYMTSPGVKTVYVKEPQFSKQEIKTLISLCHPDKHRGSAIANEVTAKLLSMR